MSVRDEQVDLTNCDREPIHKLGSIQNFGALVATDAEWKIAHRSANIDEILGVPVADWAPGTPLSDIFGEEAMRELRQSAAMLVGRDDVERLFGLDLLGDGALFDCALHRSGRMFVIEAERHAAAGMDRQLRLLQPVVRTLEHIDDIEELCGEAARHLKQLLGFDRVMVYRFHPDLSGEVIAEAREDRLEPFLGLRYPQSDIPQQARELYVRNRFRIISDVNSDPVPIEPENSSNGEALDLSMSTLRAVSRIHIEYLANMGVEASLSISIVVDGKLWGLFACHHYSPRVLPYSRRTGAELFSEMFSLVIERTLARTSAGLQETSQVLHDRLTRAVASGQSLVESLPALRPIIQRALPHDGASVFVDGVYNSIGTAPGEREFRAILPALDADMSNRVMATENLSEFIPEAGGFADIAAGALIIPISRCPGDYLVLWRKELKQVVRWAGNPVKAVETGPHGDRLTPRKSFEAWQESVRGRSEQWHDQERRIAENLRVTLLEVVLRLTEEAHDERARAQQQQELLIAELNHRVRNILNLIRGLINQSRHEAMDIGAFVKLIGGRINALATAHDNITRVNWSPASLSELIQTEAEAYFSGKLDRVMVSGDEALLAPDAYTVLALVLHEMITNSAKYGALCDRSGQLDIEVDCGDSGMTIRWKERGGPPVKAPERRGFGSTIIEKSIPFELNGRARLDYKLEGVEAEFWIPARYVTCIEKAADPTQRQERANRMKSPTKVSEQQVERVLLIEDNMIIALDTEECLVDLGVDEVVVQGSVEGALNALKSGTFGLALLDYNLGTESSERVATELRNLGVPFWLATGYGEMEDKLEQIGAQGLLIKPYGRTELKEILGSASPGG